MKKITAEEIERILDESVRFRLRMHGGDIHLVDITPEGTARFRLTGACAGAGRPEPWRMWSRKP